MSEPDFDLDPSEFEPLEEFAPASLEATRLALERARRSADQGRVPIAGAAVHMDVGGRLTTVSVGHNGRIPAPDESGPGYPTDHGETATIRRIEDVGAQEWDRIVFATTLSPCIMCNRSLAYLHGLGLRRIVVAEAASFAGTAEELARLPGTTVLGLTNPGAVRMMKRFARTYPWDWNADIGLIPPRDTAYADGLAADETLRGEPLERVRTAQDGEDGSPGTAGVAAAGVFGADGDLLATASDARAARGGNPCASAPMVVMGRAGSAVNLRECVLALSAPGVGARLDLAAFGHASLGACELFRPRVLLTDGVVEAALRSRLEAADVAVLDRS